MRVIIQPDGMQRILENTPQYHIDVTDIRQLEVTEKEKALDEKRAEMSHQVIQTDEWPLFDVRITKIEDQKHRIHISFDNIIFDGWSMFHLLNEWAEVYRNGKYDEVILYYLMKYRFGPMDELLSIWKSARGFEMETYDLEERILSLLIFTSDYRKEGEAVLESYVSQSGKERIIGAYLTQVAYGVFVKEYTMSAFVRGRLEYAYLNKWPVNRICRLALLKEISREQDPKPEYIGIQQGILKECAKEHLMSAFSEDCHRSF